MVNYLNATLNDTDVLGGSASSFWDSVSFLPCPAEALANSSLQLYDGVYFGAATWKTIDGGTCSFAPILLTTAHSSHQV